MTTLPFSRSSVYLLGRFQVVDRWHVQVGGANDLSLGVRTETEPRPIGSGQINPQITTAGDRYLAR